MKIEQMSNLMKRAVRFQYGEYDNRYGSANVFFIALRNDNIYAITTSESAPNGSCYDKEMDYFRYEPLASSRTEEFFENTRFSLEEAMEIAERIESEGLYNFMNRRLEELRKEGIINV